ncbi:MAG: hypothetical protein H8E35_03715 [Ardenticatenia bacterium]|nr:hypothetical protein [Ardenticatenia bacterium]
MFTKKASTKRILFERVFTSLITVAAILLFVTVGVVYGAPLGNPPLADIAVKDIAAMLGGSLLFLTAISTVLELVVTTFQPLIDLLPGESPKTYVLSGLGICFSVLMGVNIFAPLAIVVDFVPANSVLFHWAGLVLTGLLCGSGSRAIHSWLEGLPRGKVEAQPLADIHSPNWP